MPKTLAAVAYILTCSAVVRGVSIPFQKSSLPYGKTRFSTRLSAGSSDPFGFQNMRDNVYTGQLIVAGQNFTVRTLTCAVIHMNTEDD